MPPLQASIKKACLIFGTLFLLSLPVVWISLFFTNYHGDLTRIGKWTEHDFSWQIPQPAIDSSLLQSSPLDQADILVIGDSFSENLYWQSVLTQSGKKVATIHWRSIGFICEDFQKQLLSSGFKGKHIIVQAVERGAAIQFEKSVACTSSKPLLVKTERTSNPIPSSIKADPAFNINGQFIAGLETLLHSAAIRVSPHYSNIHNYKSKGAYIQAIENGCQYFSHHLCQYGLFLHEDYQRPPLTEKTIAHMKVLKKRLDQYQTAWVVIPNKSSIYDHKLSTEVMQQFWKNLESAQLGPNLYKTTQEEKRTTKDLYLPNDTHYGPSGYRFAGEQIASFIKLNK
jgi:SGNH hydrolase-like domain, acetyltransferase AlgX